jgi:hypothetical protein
MIVGPVLASDQLARIGTGVQLATGLQTGACRAVESTRCGGLIATGRQPALAKFTDKTSPSSEQHDCKTITANLKQAARKID